MSDTDRPVPKFQAAGEPTSATLAGLDESASQWRTSTELTSVLEQATDPANLRLYGSVFEADPGGLALLMKDPTGLTTLGRSLIFRAVGSTPGSPEGLGWGGQPGDYSSTWPATMQRVQEAADLFQLAIDFVAKWAAADRVAETTEAARLALRSLLDLDYGEMWWALWTNEDDTDVAGAVVVREHAGKVGVLGFWKVA